MTLPLVEELRPFPDVSQALQAFADQPGLILLDTALQREPIGRYSFLAADPFDRVILQRVAFGDDPFAGLRSVLSAWETEPIADLPPFQGVLRDCFPTNLGVRLSKFPGPPSMNSNSPTLPSASTIGSSPGTIC